MPIQGTTSRPGVNAANQVASSHEVHAEFRDALLRDTDEAADALLRLCSGDPLSVRTSEMADELLGPAMRALDTQLQILAEGVAQATHCSPDTARNRILDAMIARREILDVGALRAHLQTEVCVNANELKRTIGSLPADDMQEMARGIIAHAGPRHAAPPLSLPILVDAVRETYGSHGPSSLQPAQAIAGKVDTLVNYLAPGLASAFSKFGLDQADHDDDFHDTLRKASVVLIDHGIDTPYAVNKFLTDARSHDDKIAAATGALGQLGFGVGMSTFMYAVAPKIAPALLNGTFGGAVAMGAAAGAMVGYLDSVGSSGADQLRGALTYLGSGKSTSSAADAMNYSEARDIATRMGVSAGTVAMKNLLLRAIVPTAVYGAAFPGGIDRSRRDDIDLAGDAGGAFVSGAAAKLLNRKLLDNNASSDFKLLAQDNLPQVIQRSQGPNNPAILRDGVLEYAKGLAKGAIAPSTLAVTGGVITPMVGILFGINVGAIPKGLGTALSLAKGVPDAMSTIMPAVSSTQAALSSTTSASADALPILAAEHATKACVSTALMSALAGGATGIGNLVGRHVDGCCFEAIDRAVRHAANMLRRGEGAEPDPNVNRVTWSADNPNSTRFRFVDSAGRSV